MLRQGETGDWIGTFEGHKGAVWGVALTQNGNLAASGAADFSAKLWDARFGEVLQTFDHEHIVKSVNFNAEDTLLLTASNEKLIRVYDLNKPEVGALEKLSAHTSSIRHAVFLHNSRIVSVSDDLTLRVWDRNSGQEVQKVEFSSTPNSLELSRDGAVLTVTHGTNVSFYSSDTMRLMREVAVPTRCYSASLAPSRATFVCGGEDLKVYKFDYNTGTELESNKGHFGPVHCVRWSPDGELYATGSEDGTVRLWQAVPGRVYGLWKRSNDAAPLANGFKEVAAN
ncbi:serine-threonine kinase receptor-associated protein isoform X2 [Pieris rapae]|nr:serine-threonine kinase receptor-associated protein isoform X2 [Pieris rapae]